MKKTIVILMAAILCSLIFAGSAAASSQGGLHDGVYEIYDAADLVNFAAAVNGGQTTLPAKLMADIDLSGRTYPAIGTDSNGYDGDFDGNGCTISGLSTVFIISKSVTIHDVGFLNSNLAVNAVIIKFAENQYNPQINMQRILVESVAVTYTVDSSSQTYRGGLFGGGKAIDYLVSKITASDMVVINCHVITSGNSDSSLLFSYPGIFNVSNIVLSGCSDSISSKERIAGLIACGYPGTSTVSTHRVVGCVAIDSTVTCPEQGPSGFYSSVFVAGNPNRDVYRGNLGTSNSAVSGRTFAAFNGVNVGQSAHTINYYRNDLGWDFVNTWYWDDVDKIPKLQVFRTGVQISSVTVTSSDLAAAGHDYINATVTASSGQGTLTYQWYRSTSSGAAWTLLPGQTTAALSYIPTGTGRNFLKVIVSDGTSTVDSYSDAGFTDVYVRVLQAYDPLPVVAKPSSIQAKTSEPYQATQEFDFDISAIIYDVAWLGNDTAYVAAGNAIYAISGYMAEVMPVSDWTGNTIRKAYIGTNRGIIEDVSSNVAVYDYKTRSAQYISHDGADHVAVTANYAAIVKDNTLYVYDKNNRLIGSIATGSIKSIYGNDKLDIFTSVSTAGYKPITVYSISGSTIVKTDLDNYNSPDILPIRYTDNYILTYNNGVDHVNIIKTTASALTTVYGTQAGKYTSMQATVNNALIGAKQNTVEIRGVNGALVGTYDTGGNINDVSISRDTGLFAIVGGEDNQAYFLNKYESSNWVLGQKVNFRETVYKSQISTDGTFAVVGTTNKLFLWKYTEIIESTFFINGVVIGSDGLAYANKAITIDTDTVITDDSGFFVYPVRPGQTYTITAGSQTTRYTATNQALQTLSIRIQSQLIAQDVTYSAVYNAETGNIEMSYADSGAKTTSVTWKIRDTHSGQTVYQQTGESGSFFVPTDKQSSNYFVSVEADRQNTVVKNTWSITPSGVGQEVNLFGLDDTGKNILFGFFLIVLAGLFGYLHQHIGTIIIAFTAAVLRYLGLITIPWIMIIIAVVVAIVAAIANRSAGK